MIFLYAVKTVTGFFSVSVVNENYRNIELRKFFYDMNARRAVIINRNNDTGIKR